MLTTFRLSSASVTGDERFLDAASSQTSTDLTSCASFDIALSGRPSRPLNASSLSILPFDHLSYEVQQDVADCIQVYSVVSKALHWRL